MANRPSLDDYVDVAERIQDFKDAHPDGSLQTLGWEVVTVEGVNKKSSKPESRTFIVYRAAAYREPGDPTPGHGIAWEPWPGQTPYTSDSELMNAETAAWGRAIVALGLVANRSLASRQEVRNRREDQAAEAEAPTPAPEPAPTPAKAKAKAAPKAAPKGDAEFLEKLRALNKTARWPAEKMQWKLIELGVEVAEGEALGDTLKGLDLDTAEQLAQALGGTLLPESALDDGVPGSGATA